MSIEITNALWSLYERQNNYTQTNTQYHTIDQCNILLRAYITLRWTEVVQEYIFCKLTLFKLDT